MIERLAGRAQFQRLGPAAALIDGWMGKHLKISDASKARIQGKVQSVIRQLQDETLRLRDDTNNKILDALTPQHRALVTQLLGEPIAREQCNPGLLLLQLTSWNSGQR